jgi:YHS domain-containing protein
MTVARTDRTGMAATALLALLAAGTLACRSGSRGGDRGGAPAPSGPPGAKSAAAADVAAPVAPPGSPDEIVVDPYCGVALRRAEAAASATWNGVTYWFCLADHRDAFLADPQQALERLKRSADGGGPPP